MPPLMVLVHIAEQHIEEEPPPELHYGICEFFHFAHFVSKLEQSAVATRAIQTTIKTKLRCTAEFKEN